MKEKKTKIKKDLFREIRSIRSDGKNTGITLIALIITIIVLLILAGVVINLSMGENGIIGKAQTSVDKYKESENTEKLSLSKYENEIDGYISNNRDIGIVESGANADNTAFYIKYSNGLMYQWGTCACTDNISKNNGVNKTVTFIKPFTNSNYAITITKNTVNATGAVRKCRFTNYFKKRFINRD